MLCCLLPIPQHQHLQHLQLVLCCLVPLPFCHNPPLCCCAHSLVPLSPSAHGPACTLHALCSDPAAYPLRRPRCMPSAQTPLHALCSNPAACPLHRPQHANSAFAPQAVVQSLPQIILLAISLSAIGPLHGGEAGAAQCDAPEGAIAAALAVACLNVLDKLFQSGLQVGW